MVPVYVIGAVILGLVPAYIARQRHRDFVQWWIFGAVIFPVALTEALMLPKQLCPHCQSRLNAGADACSSCGRDVARIAAQF